MLRLTERLRHRLSSDLRVHELDASRSQEPWASWDRRFVRELRPGSLACELGSVTSALFDRLDPGTVAGVEKAIAENPETEGIRSQLEDPAVHRQLVLCYGMWFGIPSVSERTGLVRAQPPDEIHAMARGPLAAAGGLYEADLVIDAFLGAGMDIRNVATGLDFGCSSGRVARVLAAAYPDISWLGCDPNDQAITWAQTNLPAVDFFVSGDQPPLMLEDASLDLAFAISIWSHFQPEFGLDWFSEMHRVIRAGGHLVITTHGITSVDFFATNHLRTEAQSAEIADALYRRGWWYAAEFGERGDWGVVNPAWGTSFISPEWLLMKLCPQWRVLEFAPGRNALNQDVYVLERA